MGILSNRFNQTLRDILAVLSVFVAIFFIVDIPLLVARVSFFSQQFIAIFWALTVSLLFLTFPASKKSPKNSPKWYDFLLASLSMVVGLYAAIYYPEILLRMGIVTPRDAILGVIATFLILESVRRTAGLAIVGVILVFVAYTKFGSYLPGIFGTGEISWSRLFQQIYLGADFMMGMPLRVVCSIVFGFILFGVIFLSFGGGDTLMNLAYSVMGRFRGGPAKVAVIASSLFGSISGSPVANVSASGMITIPLMKKTGYPDYYAGAVEAAASTGGQIMPPVMGAAAFILAEFLGISYATVVAAALVPAILFYAGLFIQIDLQAVKRHIKGMSREEVPSFVQALKSGWLSLVPVAVLIWALFVLFLAPGISALYGMTSAIIISLIKKETRALWSFKKLLGVLHSTCRAMFAIVAVCAGAGLIVGLVAYTGLGLSFSQMLTQAACGYLPILAILAAVASIVLGMGMPTAAAYIMVAVLAAPAMIDLGVEPIVAHLFVMYYAVLSMLTPPVCLAVFAAASLAEAPYAKIAAQSLKLSIAGFFTPFFFLFNPGVLMIGSTTEILTDIFFAFSAITILAVSFEGYFLRKIGKLGRFIYMAGAVAMVYPGNIFRLLILVLLLGGTCFAPHFSRFSLKNVEEGEHVISQEP
jgi:TRAP transporter 4TM/12TM fusion protein